MASRIAILALCCAGCAAPEPGRGGGGPGALEPVAEVAALVPSVLHVRWTAPAPGRSWVAWGEDPGALDHRTPVTEDEEVALALLGLPAGRTIYWRAWTEGRRTWSSDTLAHRVAEDPSVPRLEVELRDPGRSEVGGGYLLGGYLEWGGTLAGVAIWRTSDGLPVWWRPIEPGWVPVSPAWSDHRAAVRYDAYDLTLEQGGLGHLVDLDGRSEVVDPLLHGHHAAIELDPDRWAWLGGDFRDQGDRVDLTSRIYTAPLGDTSAPEVLFDENQAVFGDLAPDLCAHTTEPMGVYAGKPLYDWAHTNSMVRSPGGESLYLFARFRDALWKIDAATGALQWELGGPASDFTAPDGGTLWDGVENSALWSHPHVSEVWDGGALVFDNGDHADPQVSSVVEIAWEEEGRTAWEVWRHPHPDGAYMFVLGDARRLPEDHVLISWSRLGSVQEVDRSGAVLWEATAPGEVNLSRVRFSEDLYAIGGAR